MTELPGGPDFTDNPEESNFVKAAAEEVNKLIKANKINRRFLWALSVVSFILFAACGVLTFVVIDQHSSDIQVQSANARLRQESIASCESGNAYRTGNKDIWLKLFAISYANYPASAEERKLDNEFLAYVNAVDATHDCNQLYADAAG